MSILHFVLLTTSFAATAIYAPGPCLASPPDPVGTQKHGTSSTADQRIAASSKQRALSSTNSFLQPPVIHSANSRLTAQLTVAYDKQVIGQREVRLRCYNHGLTGPTLKARPGDTLFIRLTNVLPLPSSSGQEAHEMLNITNLHTHGLHVSPEDNSDNVFLAVKPGGVCDYEIRIPSHHVPGFHWYHAHHHHAVAVQLASGMAGGLIIEGGLDDIKEIRSAKDLLFILQQCPYDSSGEVEDISQTTAKYWHDLYRESTVNGILQPTIDMRPGEIQRWRFVHAGIAEMIELVFKNADESQQYSFHELAADGIPLGYLRETKQIELAPGYRSEVLVRAPETPGDYFVIDLSSPAPLALDSTRAEPTKYLARVHVAGDALAMALPSLDSLKAVPMYQPINPVGAKSRQLVFSGDDRLTAKINGLQFRADRTDVMVRRGATEKWTLSAASETHPFHIHVNPFQTSLTDPASNVSYSVWKDTVVIRPQLPITALMRFEDFDGKTVLHCHRLNHEDYGMMQVVRIIPPEQPVVGSAEGNKQQRVGAGGPVIAWTVQGVSGDQLSSGRYQGAPVLLVLFRGLKCLHCLEQLEVLRQHERQLKDLGVQVLLVSSDSAEELRDAVDRYDKPLPYTLASDPQLRMFGQFNCVTEESQHGLFIIDASGNVQFGHRSKNALLELDAVLDSCKAVAHMSSLAE